MGKTDPKTEPKTAPTVEVAVDEEGWETAEAGGISPEACRKLEAATGAYEVEVALLDFYTAENKPTRVVVYMRTTSGVARNFDLPGAPIEKTMPGRYVQVGFISPFQEPGAGQPSAAYAKMSLQSRRLFEAALPSVARINYRTGQVQFADGTYGPLVGLKLAVTWITGPDRNDAYPEGAPFPLAAYPQLAANPPRRQEARVRKPAAAVEGPAGGTAGGATGGAAVTGQGSWG